jgi:hypothetical protein
MRRTSSTIRLLTSKHSAHRLESKEYECGECELPPEGKEQIHDLILRSESFDRLIHIAGEVPHYEEVWAGGRRVAVTCVG